ncbi:hypothetical protein ABH935_006635 [Catenulispora sp. GAS73]|uniref:VMAP-C domain-containing protein n=1 Tax=Catenulispora sp. GAS73 TaxID=3156269 RepID=UPI003512ADC9
MAEGNITRDDALDLLGRCTVELWHPDDANRRGSGFFIAPGVVATCSHVVAACSERPMVRAGDTAVQAESSVVSQSERLSGREYTGFPDMALVYVPFERHPCVWLDRNIPTKGAELTAVTRYVPEAGDIAPPPRPILLSYQQDTATTTQSKLWLVIPPRDVSTEHGSLRITRGTSGSPVLDDQTLRVVGMVNASVLQGGIVQVVPIVSAMAAFAAVLHTEAATDIEDEPPAPKHNPVVEAWYAHDRHHGRDTEWPELVQRHTEARTRGAVPASVQLLPPRLEYPLLDLLAQIGDPWIDEEPERLYRRTIGEPDSRVTPGPIHTLRDAVWHLRAMDASRNALSTLARCVLESYQTSSHTAERIREWAGDYDQIRGSVAVEPSPSTGDQNVGWPAAVMVRLTPAYSKVGSYRASVWCRDAQGNWTSVSSGERRPARVDTALELIKEDVRGALGRLVHQRPVLEFSVPPDLFDYAFDTWELINRRPIGELHPVVVRDDDVLDDVDVHGYADQAWESFQQASGHPPVAVLCQDLPGDADRTDLFRDRFTAPLAGEPDLTGRLVLLPGPVVPPGCASNAMGALRDLWTPMVMWSRDACQYAHVDGEVFEPGEPPCGGAHFTAAAAARVGGVPAERIPIEVKVLREEARKVRRLVAAGKANPDRVNEDNPMLASAVLLWDPPNRLPLNFLLAAPGAAV